MIQLLNGDCLDVLKDLDDNSIDSIAADPIYGLAFRGKDLNNFKASRETKSQVVKAWGLGVETVIKQNEQMMKTHQKEQSVSSIGDKIMRFKQMLDDGIISDAEFQEMKSKLLSRGNNF